jgi:glucose-1-phosphate cytidylyltransferase
MKVVLFCGGLGLRLREYSESIPKPMVKIGERPILWHLMKYYAHYGHKDFILCLGYKGEVIKNYFLNYNEYLMNDFTICNGAKELHTSKGELADWRITMVDTGLKTNIGQRLKKVEKYLKDDEMFLANYADGLTDYPLPTLINKFKKTGKIGCFLCVKPPQTFHVVQLGGDNLVEQIKWIADSNIIVNGGFFVLRKEIFRYIQDGEDLVVEPFLRLIKEKQLVGFSHDRFWCMDTFKEYQELSDMDERGVSPWKVWEHS